MSELIEKSVAVNTDAKSDVESGEITDSDDLNHLEDEDEDILKLRYEALKSLTGEASDEENAAKRKKSKKRKRRKKRQKSSSSSSLKARNDNYEIQDMDIDGCGFDTILADKDMRSLHDQFRAQKQHYDEPKAVSLMDLMIDHRMPLLPSPPMRPLVPQQQQPPVFYTNDFYPTKYFEYQSIRIEPPLVRNGPVPVRSGKKAKKPQRKVKKPRKPEVPEVKPDDEEDINELRDNLLNELTQKRSQKVIIEEAQSQETQKSVEKDFDLSHYETTIQLARKQIEEANALTSAMQQQQQQRNRIMPVIIKIRKNEVTSSSSSDDDEDEEIQRIEPSISTLTLQSNICLFLNAAKEQAKLEIEKQSEPQSSSSPTKFKRLISRKDEIRVVRDRINVKSKEITECNKKSLEVKHLLLKKSKDIGVSKEKIRLLREQLQAAEKILQANEESAKDLKIKQKAFDFRLSKLKDIKKKQQEHLQNMLAANVDTAPVAKSVPPSRIVINSRSVAAVKAAVQLTVVKPAVVETTPKPVATPEPKATVEVISQAVIPKTTPAANMTSMDIDRLIETKSPIISSDLKERIDNLKLRSLIKESKPVKQTNQTQVNSSATTSNNASSSIRPKIYVSKQTNQQLQQIAIEKFASNIGSTQDNNPSAPIAPEKNTMTKKLLDAIENLLKDYPYVPMIFNKDLSLKSELKKPHFTDLSDHVPESVKSSSTDDMPTAIHNVLNYESPLAMFKGYRFSKNFCEFNNFEIAYSKYYCNSIDARKPFCPFDLNGSCKDSNCIYQHSSVMTMDNLQRTEHFLSYCPEIFNVNEGLSQKEALKRLRNYSKAFMGNHLNKMSIKDYFKYLYDEILKKRSVSSTSTSTILNRMPSLVTSSNKTVGAYDEQNYDQEKSAEPSENENLKNMNRLNRFKYRYMGDSLKDYLNENPTDIDGWLYYSCTRVNNSDMSLNILSQALETNVSSEILWTEYLDVYSKAKKLKDYNEICLLAIDNCPTYRIFWKILLTIKIEFIDEIIDRFVKYLTESGLENSEKSFYLCELVLYHVYIKLIYNGELQTAKNVLLKYLKADDVCSNTMLEHSCVLWLYLVYLNAFGCLPTIYFQENIPGRVTKLVKFLIPWNLNSKFICDIPSIRQIICEALQMFKTKQFLIDNDQAAIKFTQKQILVHALAIYENLINLEVSLKRYEIALKLCERLLMTDPGLIDIWLLQLYISFQTPTTAQKVIDNASKSCPNDAKIHQAIAQYYIYTNKNEDAVVLLEALISNYYENNAEINADILYKEILGLREAHTKSPFVLKPIVTEDYLSKQLLGINLCYCLYLNLQSLSSDEVFNFALKKFNNLTDHTTIWTRYFKNELLLNSELNFVALYRQAEKCFSDLSSFDEESKSELRLSQLVVVECLVKHCRTNKEKFCLLKHLLHLIPNNSELIKWFSNFLISTHSSNPSVALQCLYDHLVINSIKCDSIWILCMKMCLEQNDFHQAQSIYKKALFKCENSITLKKLSMLFHDEV